MAEQVKIKDIPEAHRDGSGVIVFDDASAYRRRVKAKRQEKDLAKNAKNTAAMQDQINNLTDLVNKLLEGNK